MLIFQTVPDPSHATYISVFGLAGFARREPFTTTLIYHDISRTPSPSNKHIFVDSQGAARRQRMSTSSGTPETWIASFCSLLGHEYFAEVSEEFIEDDFNLTGLQSQVQLYKEALEVRAGGQGGRKERERGIFGYQRGRE